MDRMHLMSLSVGVNDADFSNTYDELSELARRFGQMFPYATLSMSDFNDDDACEVTESEDRCDHDTSDDVCVYDNTMNKVREAIEKVGAATFYVDDIINELQNAGILFRERRR